MLEYKRINSLTVRVVRDGRLVAILTRGESDGSKYLCSHGVDGLTFVELLEIAAKLDELNGRTKP